MQRGGIVVEAVQRLDLGHSGRRIELIITLSDRDKGQIWQHKGTRRNKLNSRL